MKDAANMLSKRPTTDSNYNLSALQGLAGDEGIMI